MRIEKREGIGLTCKWGYTIFQAITANPSLSPYSRTPSITSTTIYIVLVQKIFICHFTNGCLDAIYTVKIVIENNLNGWRGLFVFSENSGSFIYTNIFLKPVIEFKENFKLAKFSIIKDKSIFNRPHKIIK